MMLFRYCSLLLFILACFTQQQANASQPIEISITSDEASGLDVIQAQTAFDNHGYSLRRILLAIAGYADLHPWIISSTLVESGNQDGTEFLIEFKFPWPVRHRWSRIAVHREGENAIGWHQIAGNMQYNEGQLRFSSSGNQSIDVSMSAIIGIGLPEILTREFKKQFVKDFIKTAYDQAAASIHAELTLPSLPTITK
jgi:hypothetical protein